MGRLKDGISFIKDRLPPLSQIVATVAAVLFLVFIFGSMQELDNDPLRYPGRDYQDEARLAKRKAADGSGYYFNYEGHTYFQRNGGGQPVYVGPADPADEPGN